MLENPRDEGSPTGQGGGGGPGDKRPPQAMAAPRAWMGLSDPRIVRVSRSLGGKDRHSKVSTIRGLRDRRVRLSVPMALQLYDLQDKLGLSQPSKAVDWLLNAAQQEIDKLPPLQFTPGSFIQFPPTINAPPHGTDPHDQPTSGPAMAEGMELIMREDGSGSLTLLPSRDHMGVQTAGVHRPTKHWTSELIPSRARWKENTRGATDEKDGLIRRLVEQDRHHCEEVHGTVVAPVHPSLPSMASNNNAYAPYYCNFEGSNICVAHVGGYVIPQGEENHGYRPQQLLLCPSGMPSPMFSLQTATPPADYYPKHANSST